MNTVKCAAMCLAAVLATGATASETNGFMAGFARIDITPPIGTPLAGYYHRRVSDGVRDPLYARCLAVSDGKNRALVLSIDNLHLCQSVFQKTRETIARKTGLPIGSVFLACTHTHTGPVTYIPADLASGGLNMNMKVEDTELVNLSNMMTAERCADAGLTALADLAPATILMGRGEAKGISFIRRYRMKDGTVRTNPGANNPKIDCALGEPDEQLQLVRFVREGKPQIALVNFQCHPDTISGSKISADWPGLSCGYLEGAMNGSVCAIFLNGAQGDTNHIKTDVKPGEVVPRHYDMAHHMARTVAGAALAVWGKCSKVEAGAVSAGVFDVDVEPNKGTDEELKTAAKYVELHKTGRGSEIPGVGMEHTANVAAAYRMLQTSKMPDTVQLPVSIVAIGKTLAFCGFPGEPFTWMGTEVKARSPFAMTMPGCCVNGARGYFPVKSAYTIGGYENATSRYRAGTAERLVEGMLKNLDALYAGETGNNRQ